MKNEIEARSTNFMHKFIVEKCTADIYFILEDYKNAFKLFKKLKKDCEYEHSYKEKIICYQRIGRIQRAKRNYAEAVRAFKKMMSLAWMERDTTLEAKAYEELAVDYFYLGEIGKSEYYHERFMRGKTENDTSIAKSVAINQIKTKR